MCDEKADFIRELLTAARDDLQASGHHAVSYIVDRVLLDGRVTPERIEEIFDEEWNEEVKARVSHEDQMRWTA